MSFFLEETPINWGPAVRYYGTVLLLGLLLRGVAYWQRWPVLPDYLQLVGTLVLLVILLWPVAREIKRAEQTLEKANEELAKKELRLYTSSDNKSVP